MYEDEYQEKEKSRKDKAKKAIALAMRSRWKEAVAVNRSLIGDFPQDLEAYNRLGKALSELGRNREAKEAFQRALEISPHNGIAKKNLDRLIHLGDETPRAAPRKGRPSPGVHRGKRKGRGNQFDESGFERRTSEASSGASSAAPD